MEHTEILEGTAESVTRLAERVESARASALRELDLDAPSHDVLSALRRPGHDGTPDDVGLTAGDLARACGVTPGAVSQRLTRLEQNGLVERIRDDADRRTVRVVPTERGRRLGERADAALAEAEAGLLGALTPVEAETVTGIIESVLDGRG